MQRQELLSTKTRSLNFEKMYAAKDPVVLESTDEGDWGSYAGTEMSMARAILGNHTAVFAAGSEQDRMLMNLNPASKSQNFTRSIRVRAYVMRPRSEGEDGILSVD